VPEHLPSRWGFNGTFQQYEVHTGEITLSIWAIFWSVQFEAFLWGFGTAIGELPPYYVTRFGMFMKINSYFNGFFIII
jgi:hypothetical protein